MANATRIVLQFHFEDISKHAERVQGKLQTIGLSRAMSSREYPDLQALVELSDSALRTLAV